MRTLGVDLAAEAANTAIAAIDWSPAGAHVHRVQLFVDDDELVNAI